MVRLNKYLADCGIGSRRSSETLIKEGKIKVNGRIVTDLSFVVNEENDTVFYDNHKIQPAGKKYYIMLHKPKGVVSTAKDELGRKTVLDLVDIKARLYPVGRLDYDSEGLILLTNDGDLANLLTHPRNEVPKTYSVRINGTITEAELSLLRNGVIIDGKKTAKANVKITETAANPVDGERYTKLEITLREGRNHQIKNMFSAVEKEVVFLKRIQIGELRLGGLTRGTYRHLTEKEIKGLKGLA